MVFTVFSGAMGASSLMGQNNKEHREHSLGYYDNRLNATFEVWAESNDINTANLNVTSAQQLFASFLNATPSVNPIMVNITNIESNDSTQQTYSFVTEFMNGSCPATLLTSTSKNVTIGGNNYTYVCSRYLANGKNTNWSVLKSLVYNSNVSLVIDAYVLCTVTSQMEFRTSSNPMDRTTGYGFPEVN